MAAASPPTSTYRYELISLLVGLLPVPVGSSYMYTDSNMHTCRSFESDRCRAHGGARLAHILLVRVFNVTMFSS